MQPDPAGPVGVLQRERQRRVARAGAQDDVADAAANQFVDDDAGLCRRGVHHYSLSAKKFNIAALTTCGFSMKPRCPVSGISR